MSERLVPAVTRAMLAGLVSSPPDAIFGGTSHFSSPTPRKAPVQNSLKRVPGLEHARALRPPTLRIVVSSCWKCLYHGMEPSASPFGRFGTLHAHQRVCRGTAHAYRATERRLASVFSSRRPPVQSARALQLHPGRDRKQRTLILILPMPWCYAEGSR
jgi:hypothetical protein